jgi:translation initiation factor eIF-2B subunit epsilon
VQGQIYRLQRGNIYKEDGVVLARGCTVKKHTVIGAGTSIGDGSVVGDSIIGRGCHIGKNVTIEGAYIWDDVSIGDGTTIRRAVVAHEAVIGRGCTVEPGSLLSFGVKIADKVTIKGNSRVSRLKRNRGDGPLESVTDIQIVGEGGEGYEFHGSDSEDEDADDKDARGLGKTYTRYLLPFFFFLIGESETDVSSIQST